MSLQQLCGTPIPDRDPIASKDGVLTPAWHGYLGRLPLTLDSTPIRVASVALTDQGASIGATNMAPAGLPAGVYRVTYYARISVPGTVSSSLEVDFNWTDSGIAQGFPGSAITGNTTSTSSSETVMFRMDAGGAVYYATTYASAGATSMQHSLYIELEMVKAL